MLDFRNGLQSLSLYLVNNSGYEADHSAPSIADHLGNFVYFFAYLGFLVEMLLDPRSYG